MSAIEFFDELPGHGNGHRGRRAEIIDELKAAPGRWAKVEEDANPGAVQHWKLQGCEAVTRDSHRDDKGRTRCSIYARWPAKAES